MNNFLLYICKIVLLSYGIAYFLQNLADEGLLKSDIKMFLHWDSILQGKINRELLILGSSRGVVSYDPDIFSNNTGLSSFNLSFDAASYNLQQIKFKAYLEKNSFPFIIVQNVDISHFSKSELIPQKEQFIPFISNDLLRYELTRVEKGYKDNYYIPLAKYNRNQALLIKGLFNFFTRGEETEINIQGFRPVSKKFIEDVHNLTRLKILENDSLGFNNYLKGLEALEKQLTDKIPSNTLVFLVWAPEHIERLKFAPQVRNKVENYLIDLDNKFSNVFFLNYSKDSVFQNGNLFYDTFHLNKKGATIFSEKVSMDIVKIIR